MIILQDTKEKLPWNLTAYGQCDEQREAHLLEGDYTLADYPLLIAIERKRNTSEIAMNLGRKFKQFQAEMDRLQQYRFRYVLCEFFEPEVANYPHSSKLPQAVKAQVRVNGKFLLSRISYLQDTYGIEFIYCGNRKAAMTKAMELLINAENIVRKERVDTERSRSDN
jgi:hypothetical protein